MRFVALASVLLNLSPCGPWQLEKDRQALRHLESGEAGAGEVTELLRAQRANSRAVCGVFLVARATLQEVTGWVRYGGRGRSPRAMPLAHFPLRLPS